MTKKTNTTKQKSERTPRFQGLKSFINNRQTQTVFGLFLILFSIFLIIAFFSFFFSWQADQSTLSQFTDITVETKNLLGKIGAKLSHIFIYNGFGIAAFIIPVLFFLTGFFGLFKIPFRKVVKTWNLGLVIMLWTSITFGFVPDSFVVLAGIVGVEINDYLQTFLGKTGLAISLSFLFLTYIIIHYKITPEGIINKFRSKKEKVSVPISEENTIVNEDEKIENEFILEDKTPQKSEFERSVQNLKPTISNYSGVKNMVDEESEDESLLDIVLESESDDDDKEIIDKEVIIDVQKISEEKHLTENLSEKLLKDFGEFDPTLELSNFKFPTFNLLKQYNESISIDPEELEANKNKILETLKNYKIGIDKIKATVGPTITLYEIVPEAGVRISKIKNLEDDIALSLSALGIRIIAPIPGKGTIGIEVPNKKSTIVSMHSVISSKRFQEAQMELPIALGKTISNETFVVDLAKMPHLLMAGATGQGKSVGLNVVLTSLIYKKHPAEVKFVLIDPKKVELTLFNKIERHYLAKLPNTDDAIITDTTKVIHTLNSLCIEMDNRYDLLKLAMVRNIKEYNDKFKERKLNPNDGHQFLPYIVLVIDEFADLIMTDRKSVV